MSEPHILETIATAPEASEGALERARLRAEYFAIHAAATEEVRAFRRRVIAPDPLRQWPPASEDFGTAAQRRGHPDSAVVAPEVARAFLASNAAVLLTIQDFEAAGVPIMSHRSEVGVWRTEITDEKAPFLLTLKDHHGANVSLVKHPPMWFPVWFPAIGEQDWTKPVRPARPGSVLDDLEQLGEQLSTRFPWDPAAAVWFVLTDEPPLPPLIRTGLDLKASSDPRYTDARITLSVDATLPPEEVARHYAEVRDQLLGGVRIRRAEARTHEIFRFVSARRLQHPSITWGELVREWDQTAPTAWRFDGNEKAFQVYWRRGFRSVFPEFRVSRVRQPDVMEEER